MKRQIVQIVLLMFLLLPVGGCWEEIALVGGGAVGGMSWERFITQAQEDVEENIKLLEADNEKLKKELAETTDEAKRAELHDRINDNLKMLEDLGVAKLSLAEAKKGLGVDWNNPEAAAIFILGAITTFMQYRQRKKTGTALAEVVAGGQAFKSNLGNGTTGGDSTAVLKAFKEAQGGAQSLETKKLVAMLKAT